MEMGMGDHNNTHLYNNIIVIMCPQEYACGRLLTIIIMLGWCVHEQKALRHWGAVDIGMANKKTVSYYIVFAMLVGFTKLYLKHEANLWRVLLLVVYIAA